MDNIYREYSELAAELKDYSEKRKGEISRLSYRAALAIDTLVGRLKILEGEDDQK